MGPVSRCIVAIVITLLAVTPTLAQGTYPSRPVRMVVGAAPGGTTDLVARFFGEYFTKRTGAQAIVENVSGAAGNIASQQVVNAAPDGYTFGFVSAGNIVINPVLYKDMRFNPVEDLVPVAIIADAPQIVVTNNDVPARSLRELLDLAKAKPNSIFYGSAGLGSTPHLGGALLGKVAGVALVHVPYRGTAPATTDLVGGRIQMMSVAVPSVITFVRSNHLRALAVVSPQRLPDLPDVPTTTEAGLPGYSLSNWFGIVAPKGTPAAIVERLNGLVRDMIADPSERKRLEDNFLVPMAVTPDAFGRLIRSEAAMWAKTIPELDIRVD